MSDTSNEPPAGGRAGPPADPPTVAFPVGPEPAAPWGTAAVLPPAPVWSPPPAAPPGAPGFGAPGYGPAGYPPGYPPAGSGAPPAQRRSGLGCGFALAGFALLAAIVFLAGALIVQSGSDDDGDDVAAGSEEAASTTPADGGPATTTLPGGRLAPAPAIPAQDGPHTFIREEADGDPAAWDPCEPIRYVVNSRRAPAEAMGIMEQAFAMVSEATGLVFVDEGDTDEQAPPGEGGGRPDRDPRYGDDFSPVLITWTDVMEDPELDGLAGLAFSTEKTSAAGETVLVTGYVEMAGDYAAGLIADGRRDDVLSVMMHELGHLVGLGHVTEPTEVMTDDPSSTPAVWGPGDLMGLAQVGNGECAPDL